jgi:hypothetical protein
MRRVASISALLASLAACASFPPDARLTQTLRDCTEQFGGWAGKPALDMPVAERELVLNSATQWAIREEYFPCNVTVCGAVVNASSDEVSVFLTGYSDFLNPSATVTFYRPSYIVKDSVYHHSGCPGGVYGPTSGKRT